MEENVAKKKKKLKIVEPETVERTAPSGEAVDVSQAQPAPVVKGVERMDAFAAEVKEALGEPPPENPNALDKLPVPAGRIVYLPLKALKESPTNPRKTFAKMEELTASVKSSGLLVPLIVRALEKDVHEIVAGHRRYRAAKGAGLKEVPCDVRELTDAQVTEIQITENLQRADLSDLEEAETYEALRDLHHYSVDQIAAKIGVSKATIYSRLKLLALCPEARKALADGFLPASVGVPLARLPTHKLQASALKEMKDRWTYDAGTGSKGVVGAREAIDYIQREFCRTLKGAAFPTGDETLVPEAGSCKTCPKNTATGTPGLFEDLKGAGQTCTDVGCFKLKQAAFWKRTAKKEEEKGAMVLSQEEGSKLFAFGDKVAYGSKYVELNEKNHADPKKRTWAELLESVPADKAPPRVVAPDRGLNPHHLVDREALVKVLADEKGLKWAAAEVDRSSDLKEEKAEEREKRLGAEQREEAMLLAIAKAAAVYAKDVKDDPVWRLMAMGLTATYAIPEVLKALGWDDLERIESGKATVAECVRFVIVRTVTADRDADYSEGYPESLKRWTRSLGVDVGAIFDAQAAAAEAEKLMKKKGKD